MMFAGPLFDWRLLVEDSCRVLAEESTSLSEFLEQEVAGAPLSLGPNESAFKFGPFENLGLIGEELELWATQEGDLLVPLAREVLVRPPRVYPSGPTQQGRSLVTAAVCAHGGDTRIAIARMTYESSRSSFAGGCSVGTFGVDVIETSESARLDAEFERIFLETADHRRAASASNVPRVLVLGGTPAKGLDREWEMHMKAACAVYGTSVSVIQQPQVLSVTRRSLATEPDVVVLWVARPGKPETPKDLAEDLNLAYVVRLEQWALAEALTELRAGLVRWYSAGGGDTDGPPAAGEVRYYRKRRGRGGPGHDLMRQVGAPTGVKWQPVGGAPKARKGIEHLEQTDVAKLERSAKGGSLWKATF